MTVSITWEEAQELLATECAEALQWYREQVTWDTEAEVNHDDLIRLALVSSIDQRDHSADLDDQLIETRNYTTQGVVQIRVETTDPGHSITDCGKLKRWLSRGEVQQALADAGLAVLREPGPLQTVPFTSRGVWVSLSQFEITVSFNTCETDDQAYRVAAERVEMDGTVNGIDLPVDVDKP